VVVKSIAEDWGGMKNDPALWKKFGKGWLSRRSRLPEEWRQELNERRVEDGMPQQKRKGRKATLKNIQIFSRL